jgi:hypothetical protein
MTLQTILVGLLFAAAVAYLLRIGYRNFFQKEKKCEGCPFAQAHGMEPFSEN